MTVHPFEIDISHHVIDDLRDRLRGTRWPDQIGGAWQYGADIAYLKSLVAYWSEEFDWFAQQSRLNNFHQSIVQAQGFGVHVVHQRAKVRSPQPLPLLMLHGWPSSFVQMLPMIPLLTQPDDPADAFDVVVMSMPGYGFSDRPTEPGMDVGRIAGLAGEVMAELGYPRFAARGSDLGAGVLQQLALSEPERLIALHLSGTNPYLGGIPDDLSDAEKTFVRQAQEWDGTEMAYAKMHSTKPQTVALGLNDSPAGLAAWILEKFRRWSDGELEAVYRRDDLLTNLTIYWATQTIGSSMRLYYESAHSTNLAWGRVETPTAMAMSGADMFPTPREWAARSYNIARWTDLPRGGHFLEWEVPDLIAADIRTFLRDRRA